MSCSYSEQSQLLALPAELRNRIYDYLVSHDIETYADTPRNPALLDVSEQLHREYSSVFFGSDHLKLDAYYNATDTWAAIHNAKAKRAIIGRSTFTDLSDFWSLAAARRYCQRVCYNRENLQRGIMTVSTDAGLKRWHWSVSEDE